ncbi:MAG TPA: type I DNA topoisomerase [Dehalococcoidia bacterium]|nr:type I DNA topoisomerase [Dehalococcoidia bacterium]
MESPAKARTLGQILGKGYTIRASLGHVRDLPQKTLGIDIDNAFQPKYSVIYQRRKLINEIRELASTAENIYLATDPDREGEAISWHLAESAKLKETGKPLQRVVFHEITSTAVKEAFNNPRSIDINLVNAQQARRLLDRLVGYKLSPLLWKKVMKGLSAGRVQSAALRIIVDREREIEKFVSEEFWTIEAELKKLIAGDRDKSFKSILVGMANIKQLTITNEETSNAIVNKLQESQYSVDKLIHKQQSRQPAPPFTTSTMQQEAFRRLHFTAKHTMAIAQQLYEGIALGTEGTVGLITYMRTDSTHVASSALNECREYIKNRYGQSYLPLKPRVFGKKSKFTQEAHEAIRPTGIFREPDSVRKFLKNEQFKLYELIWKRMVASQMSEAIYNIVTVDILATTKQKEDCLFKSGSSRLTFAGFTALYSEGKDEDESEGNNFLPELSKDEKLELIKIVPKQNFTQPPARYNEATIIKALEQKGIGRPSTYAPIISTIQGRDYVHKEKGRFKPLEIGLIVNDLLVNNFPAIVDLNFTAQVEGDLDRIAAGQKNWVEVLEEFYVPFNKALVQAAENIQKVKIEKATDVICPDCERPMVIKLSRFGEFLGCSGYPECTKTMKIQVKTGIACPKCGVEAGGELIERKNRQKRKFYGCINYPHCDFVTNFKPLPQPCPDCGKLLVQAYKNTVKCTSCKYSSNASPADSSEATV